MHNFESFLTINIIIIISLHGTAHFQSPNWQCYRAISAPTKNLAAARREGHIYLAKESLIRVQIGYDAMVAAT